MTYTRTKTFKTQNSKIHIIKCDGEVVRKTTSEAIKFFEAKGYQAERSKEYAEAHNYFQHAEHYKRSKNAE